MSGRNSFSATVRSLTVSYARYTSPIPPTPMSDRNSYGPNLVSIREPPHGGAIPHSSLVRRALRPLLERSSSAMSQHPHTRLTSSAITRRRRGYGSAQRDRGHRTPP